MRQMMKLPIHVDPVKLMLVALVLVGVGEGCRNSMGTGPTDPPPGSKQPPVLLGHADSPSTQVNLVADLPSFNPRRVDGNLMNAWGLAETPNGRIWISANHTGVAVVYDTAGSEVRSAVTIPSVDSGGVGAPTGVVFNQTAGFIIPGTGQPSKFIFASEDGIILAWNSGSAASIVVNRSSMGAVYKGIAMGQAGGQDFIYATNFRGGSVDAFDAEFNYDSTKKFQDPGIPSGFAPFNIQNINGLLFVTYAKQKGPDNMDDTSGLGNGFIDVFTTAGWLVERFASQGMLNSPWGLAAVPVDGSGRLENAILVGNFGDGHINVFSEHGRFIGQLSDTSGNPFIIRGLWALAFDVTQVDMKMTSGDGEDGFMHPEDHGDGEGGDGGGGHEGDGGGQDGGHDQGHGNGHDGKGLNKLLPRLFFTAGPNEESDGIFGYLRIMK